MRPPPNAPRRRLKRALAAPPPPPSPAGPNEVRHQVPGDRTVARKDAPQNRGEVYHPAAGARKDAGSAGGVLAGRVGGGTARGIGAGGGPGPHRAPPEAFSLPHPHPRLQTPQV